MTDLWNENVSDVRFVVWDTETTGISPANSYIVEIAALAFDEEFTHRSFETLVKPPAFIPPEVTKIHGIDDAMVVQAPPTAEGLDLFYNFLTFAGQPRVLLAHNAGFDVSFIHAECGRTNPVTSRAEATPEIVLDTCMIAKNLLPQLKHHNLSTLAAYFRVVPPARYHRAMADVEVLRQIFMKLLELAVDAYGNTAAGLTLQVLLNIAGGYYLLDRYNRDIQRNPFYLSPRLEMLKSLCGTDAQVSITYENEDDVRYITPVSVNLKGFRVYVEAFCHRDNIKKTFRADRILRIQRKDV